MPSGVSYVLENRRAMTQALPGLFASMRVRPMSDYPERLLAALQLSEAWAQGRGVCQDFAHIALGALRGLGVAARYVSGYLHPDATAGVGGTVTGQSHAWVQWWVGEWFAFDPTNDRPAGLDHVVVATGRDYGDVSPFRGVISGGAGSRMTVEVQLTRER